MKTEGDVKTKENAKEKVCKVQKTKMKEVTPLSSGNQANLEIFI